MRAAAAVESLKALCLFLRDPLLNSSLTAMQATLRHSVTLEQMGQIIALGPMLYKVVVEREALVRSASSLVDDSSGCSDQERMLWYATVWIDVCVLNELSVTNITFPRLLQDETQRLACHAWTGQRGVHRRATDYFGAR